MTVKANENRKHAYDTSFAYYLARQQFDPGMVVNGSSAASPAAFVQPGYAS
jgi:hypothetical protein